MADAAYVTIPYPYPGRPEDPRFRKDIWIASGSPENVILAEGWTSIGEDVFRRTKSLKRIRIPASVIQIGDGAFDEATSLREVIFEEGSRLEVIRNHAFCYTESLTTIRIPASVTHFGDGVFQNARNLREVIIEEGSRLQYIGDNVFREATALETFRIPAGVTQLGYGVFCDATSLQTIHIPRLIRVLNIRVLSKTPSLREVTFEPGSLLETIKAAAFHSATALETIRIPRGVTEIHEEAFTDTTNLREIIFEHNSQIARTKSDYSTKNDINAIFKGSGLKIVVIGESALNRLNVERRTLNMEPLRFGENNNFYGKRNVKIVSRKQEADMLHLITRESGYPPRPATGFIGSIAQAIGLSKPPPPPQKTRPPLPKHLANYASSFLMEEDVVPKSGNTLSDREFARATAEANPEKIAAANARVAAIEAKEGGARKSRRRRQGIRRKSRKASSTRRTQKRKSKRRRTIKRK
jgi:hypothetical protein